MVGPFQDRSNPIKIKHFRRGAHPNYPSPNVKTPLPFWAEILARNYHISWCQKWLFWRLQDVMFATILTFFSTSFWRKNIASRDGCVLLRNTCFWQRWLTAKQLLHGYSKCIRRRQIGWVIWRSSNFGPFTRASTSQALEWNRNLGEAKPGAFRTLSGLFLVGAVNRPRKRKRTKIGKIPRQSLDKSGTSRKNRESTSADRETPLGGHEQ